MKYRVKIFMAAAAATINVDGAKDGLEARKKAEEILASMPDTLRFEPVKKNEQYIIQTEQIG